MDSPEARDKERGKSRSIKRGNDIRSNRGKGRCVSEETCVVVCVYVSETVKTGGGV